MIRRILAIMLAGLALASCYIDLGLTNSFHDITVENNTTFVINVYITRSTSEPGMYIEIPSSSTATFVQVRAGTCYLHVSASDIGAPISAKNHKLFQRNIRYSGTWTISWASGAYRAEFN